MHKPIYNEPSFFSTSPNSQEELPGLSTSGCSLMVFRPTLPSLDAQRLPMIDLSHLSLFAMSPSQVAESDCYLKVFKLKLAQTNESHIFFTSPNSS